MLTAVTLMILPFEEYEYGIFYFILFFCPFPLFYFVFRECFDCILITIMTLISINGEKNSLLEMLVGFNMLILQDFSMMIFM